MRKVPHRVFALLLGLTLTVGTPAVQAAERFVSGEGRFRVDFPYGPPVESLRTVHSDLGDVELHLVSAAGPDDEVAYLVSYADYPADRVRRRGAEVLRGAVDGLLGKDGKVQSVEDVKIRKLAVRRLLFTRGDFVVRAWIFLFGPRLYQVLAVSRGPAATAEELQAFFDSFVLQD